MIILKSQDGSLLIQTIAVKYMKYPVRPQMNYAGEVKEQKYAIFAYDISGEEGTIVAIYSNETRAKYVMKLIEQAIIEGRKIFMMPKDTEGLECSPTNE